MPIQKVARLNSGEVRFAPINSDGTYGDEIVLGYNQSVTLNRSSDVKQLLSNDNTIGEVVSEVEVNVQYEFSTQIGDIDIEKLALVFNGAVSAKTYAAGNIYYNGRKIIDGATNITGKIGDPVLKDGKIYILTADATALAFSACEFASKVRSNKFKMLNAEAASQAVGRIVVDGINLATDKAAALIIPKVALRFNGEYGVIGEDYIKVSITGKAQKLLTEPIFTLTDEV
ncbi:hypothetical protein [Campylobacter sp. RM9328]|uniref:hypothetical protein n=1 Tax=Campylobacter sp. RM9328 TaxID=1705720 RepID=UPI001474C3B2|nr:hypothetical protein [Campylobacter sp. RM9328]